MDTLQFDAIYVRMLVYVNVAVSVFGFAVQRIYWPGLASVSSHPVVYLIDHRPANLPIQ
jgi:hypothetical protein